MAYLRYLHYQIPGQNLTLTIPETNIAPENRPSQKETSLLTIHFQVLCYYIIKIPANYIYIIKSGQFAVFISNSGGNIKPLTTLQLRAHVRCMDELGVLTQWLGVQCWLQHTSRRGNVGTSRIHTHGDQGVVAGGKPIRNKQVEVKLDPSLPRIL